MTFYYIWFVAPYETTNDAFIQNYAVPISAKLSNIVQKLLIDDNQLVQKGQLLIQIDPRDYEVALHFAQASYDTAKSNYDRDTALIGSSAFPRRTSTTPARPTRKPRRDSTKPGSTSSTPTSPRR